MLSLQLNIPYKCIVNTKSSKRCNLCPECPNNTKFSPQSNFSMNISILGFISAEHEDKRKIKMLGSENTVFKLQTLCPPSWMFWAGQKNDIRDKKRYQGDISFLCPPIINLIKAQVCDKKFYRDLMRIDGALGFFQETSPPNKKKKIRSVWGPVPGPKTLFLTFV